MSESSLPLVSVVMPIRNECAHIDRSLTAVLQQAYPSDRLEVIVADGQSQDGTPQRVADLATAYPATTVLLVANPSGTAASGLNAALACAHGEIIVRVDGHTVIEPTYVRECVAALRRSDAQCVGGRMDAVGETSFGTAVAQATSSPFGVGGARFHYSQREEFVDTVYLGAWWRRLFEELGGFDEEQVRNQDDEFSCRLRAHGGRILLCPTIRSRYHNRSSPWRLASQYFQYGYWKVRVLQKHPRQMQPRQFAPVTLVAGMLTALCLTPLVQGSGWLLLGILVVYLTANLAASAWAARRTTWQAALLLPVVFAILHFSYGLGFLAGLVRFAGRWGRRAPGTPPAVGRYSSSLRIASRVET